MTIKINRDPNFRILELGGGANPLVHPTVMGGRDVNVDVRICHTPDGKQTTDFTADFEQPLSIADNDFDQLVCRYCLEHVSWRKVSQFVAEMYRVVKAAGNVLIVTSNTRKQFEWLLAHPDGWDGKPFFESASCVLFGDQDYGDNTHKCYFDEKVLRDLFAGAGFDVLQVEAYGERDTDLVLVAKKPVFGNKPGDVLIAPLGSKVEVGDEAMRMIQATQHKPGFVGVKKPEPSPEFIRAMQESPVPGYGIESEALQAVVKPSPLAGMSREEMFDKHYFNGGGKVGGYAREGYRDFPVHDVTFRHVMMRNPKSVLEIGCGRGYVGKRIQDAGVGYMGLEISKHCYMTRACDPIVNMDLCRTPWGDIPQEQFDLSFSMATLEHIPEQFIVPVLREIGKRCRRHLHGIDFGGQDDGFDKTHCSLFDESRWHEFFKEAGLTDYEIVNKEDLQKWHSGYPEVVYKDDGKRKLNVGSYTTMFRHNWVNIDVHDLGQFAQANYCHYLRHDARQAFPFDTGSVDMLFAHHFLEHLNPDEALRFLKECRRLIKPDYGAMRIVVPNAAFLMDLYTDSPHLLNDFAHINDGVEQARTKMGKLNALLHAGHQSFYDGESLSELLREAGFVPTVRSFRDSAFYQMLRETSEMDFGGVSLFVDAVPKIA